MRIASNWKLFSLRAASSFNIFTSVSLRIRLPARESERHAWLQPGLDVAIEGFQLVSNEACSAKARAKRHRAAKLLFQGLKF